MVNQELVSCKNCKHFNCKHLDKTTTLYSCDVDKNKFDTLIAEPRKIKKCFKSKN